MEKLIKEKFVTKRDDLYIKGTIYRKNNDKLPIAIFSHGFMANRNMVKQYAKLLARKGYASFIFDFCGGSLIGGKSSGKTYHMSVLTEIEDLKQVIEFAKNQDYTKENDILLMGCSQGGLVSSLLAASLKDKINKLILFYPAFSIPYDARKGKMMLAKFDPNNVPDFIYCGLMKLGKRYVLDVINMNVYELIKDYENDVLIVHGDKDGIVNISYSEKAYEVYKKRNTTKKVIYKTIINGRHMFSKKHDKIAFKYIEDFISK